MKKIKAYKFFAEITITKYFFTNTERFSADTISSFNAGQVSFESSKFWTGQQLKSSLLIVNIHTFNPNQNNKNNTSNLTWI